MLLPSSFTLGASLLAIATLAAADPKPIFRSYKDGPNGVVASFNANLKAVPYTAGVWGWGVIPLECYNEAINAKLSPYDFEIFDVFYQDCPGQHWSFCRHHNAQMSQTEMKTLFSKLPVRERQWVHHVMAFTDGTGGAHMSYGNIVFNTLDPANYLITFQHETGHAFDWARSEGNGPPDSVGAEWKAAVDADSCIATGLNDPINYTEAFAETGLLALYRLTEPGGLNHLGLDWTCLSHALQYFSDHHKLRMTPSGVCDRTVHHSQTVSMGPASGFGAGGTPI